MFNRIKNIFKVRTKSPEKPSETLPIRTRRFSTDDYPLPQMDMENKFAAVMDACLKNAIHPELKKTLERVASVKDSRPQFAMDSGVKASQQYGQNIIPTGQMLWYAQQTFIGYQLCAILAQNWLVCSACLTPAEDAIRKGYDITVNNGDEIDPEILDRMRQIDADYRVIENCRQQVYFGRVFGIRVAMFKVESEDPEYYYKPFNIDGVTPGSYRGISQIDPYWITPQLDTEAAGDPSSIHFYEPTWWNIAGKLVHRTHLIIYRMEEVADLLKPAYIYGGIPLPQKIAERVYAAERIANEAPMLALTKRCDVIHVDLSAATANEGGFTKRIEQWAAYRDNYGIKALDINETMEQFDTTLADLDEVIMTQYQLVAAVAKVPATKLLGTSPKGFNATGEYEESNYHEMLESIQKHGMSPLIERHHALVIKSIIEPEFGVAPFETTVAWKPIDSMTAKELAELNKMKAETGATLTGIGAIDGEDERNRVINDPDSGYTGIADEKILVEPEESGEL